MLHVRRAAPNVVSVKHALANKLPMIRLVVRDIVPVPIDAVGQATSAIIARCRCSSLAGCWKTKERPPKRDSANVCGATCRQRSQSMQVLSTKNRPGTFSGSLSEIRAMEGTLTGKLGRRSARWNRFVLADFAGEILEGHVSHRHQQQTQRHLLEGLAKPNHVRVSDPFSIHHRGRQEER